MLSKEGPEIVSKEGPAAARGEQAKTLSNQMVRLLRRYAGRGPTRARTTIGRDHVLMMLQDTLTTSERTVAASGRPDLVEEGRQAMQAAMREEATQVVEETLGRRVIAFMSTNHLDPDVAAEIFVLEPSEAATPADPVHEAEASGD